MFDKIAGKVREFQNMKENVREKLEITKYNAGSTMNNVHVLYIFVAFGTILGFIMQYNTEHHASCVPFHDDRY